MASRGINKVILVGNLGSDPETRATNGGSIATNFRLATGEAWKDQQGQLQERTEWHRIICWGRLAEIARDYLHKGSKVYLEGRLQTRKWQDKDGKDQYTTEIVAAELQMLDRKPGSADPGPEPAPAPAAAGGGFAGLHPTFELDDDIPF